jgi:hypothetical protein
MRSGLGQQGGWDGRWAGWSYYYCGGDDKVAISAAAMSCGREGTLRQPRFPALRQTHWHRSIASSRPVFEATGILVVHTLTLSRYHPLSLLLNMTLDT